MWSKKVEKSWRDFIILSIRFSYAETVIMRLAEQQEKNNNKKKKEVGRQKFLFACSVISIIILAAVLVLMELFTIIMHNTFLVYAKIKLYLQ